jgi:hypothetical protein
MLARLSLSRRLFVAAGLTVIALLPGNSPAAHATRPAATADGLAERYYPEVRLRKLHLVRPDLIPYPISFEVYC